MNGIKIERLCWQLVNLVEYKVKRRKKNSCRVTISNAHEMTDFEINYLQSEYWVDVEIANWVHIQNDMPCSENIKLNSLPPETVQTNKFYRKKNNCNRRTDQL